MTPACEEILTDFAASYWLKLALVSALERDPVDAVADAEALANALREHLADVRRVASESAGLLTELQDELWSDDHER